jgi:hypothetical protein
MGDRTALTAAERVRRLYWRRKLGHKQIKVDVPPNDLATALIAEGWLARNHANDEKLVATAFDRMVADFIRRNATLQRKE